MKVWAKSTERVERTTQLNVLLHLSTKAEVKQQKTDQQPIRSFFKQIKLNIFLLVNLETIKLNIKSSSGSDWKWLNFLSYQRLCSISAATWKTCTSTVMRKYKVAQTKCPHCAALHVTHDPASNHKTGKDSKCIFINESKRKSQRFWTWEHWKIKTHYWSMLICACSVWTVWTSQTQLWNLHHNCAGKQQ